MEDSESEEEIELEIEKYTVIKEREILLQIKPKQAKKIKYLRIENQIIDHRVSAILLFLENIEAIFFINCNLDEEVYLLSMFPSVTKIGFIKCELTSERLYELLCALNPYEQTDLLDLSKNKLGENPKRFIEALEKNVFSFKYIETLILLDNGFDENSISEIKKICKGRVEKLII